MLSTPVLLAASISITSNAEPFAIPRHTSHTPQGSAVGTLLAKQLSDFAKMRALDVFPVPRGPVNKYAGAILLVRTALLNVVAIASCPTSCAKF